MTVVAPLGPARPAVAAATNGAKPTLKPTLLPTEVVVVAVSSIVCANSCVLMMRSFRFIVFWLRREISFVMSNVPTVLRRSSRPRVHRFGGSFPPRLYSRPFFFRSQIRPFLSITNFLSSND